MIALAQDRPADAIAPSRRPSRIKNRRRFPQLARARLPCDRPDRQGGRAVPQGHRLRPAWLGRALRSLAGGYTSSARRSLPPGPTRWRCSRPAARQVPRASCPRSWTARPPSRPRSSLGVIAEIPGDGASRPRLVPQALALDASNVTAQMGLTRVSAGPPPATLPSGTGPNGATGMTASPAVASSAPARIRPRRRHRAGRRGGRGAARRAAAASSPSCSCSCRLRAAPVSCLVPAVPPAAAAPGDPHLADAVVHHVALWRPAPWAWRSTPTAAGSTSPSVRRPGRALFDAGGTELGMMGRLSTARTTCRVPGDGPADARGLRIGPSHRLDPHLRRDRDLPARLLDPRQPHRAGSRSPWHSTRPASSTSRTSAPRPQTVLEFDREGNPSGRSASPLACRFPTASRVDAAATSTSPTPTTAGCWSSTPLAPSLPRWGAAPATATLASRAGSR